MQLKKIRTYFNWLIALCSSFTVNAQFSLDYKVEHFAEQCEKGVVSVNITGLTPSDSLVIRWSSGQTNTVQIVGVPAGEHSVYVYVKRKGDKFSFIKDTTIAFTVNKVECPIYIPKFFSPNDDQYNDLMMVSNLQYFPNFEMEIFNKWGQRVHAQKKTFTPWDGKWLGADLPDGTYYVMIFPDAGNRSKVVRQDVTILR